MPSQSDDLTRERFPEQEQVIRDIEAAIADIRSIKDKLLPELTVVLERLNKLEGILAYLSKIKKGQ